MMKRVQLLLLVVFCSVQFAKAATITDVNDIANYPYAAYLSDPSYNNGNGAIISETRVVTSASALNPIPGEPISVYVGKAKMAAGTIFKSMDFQKHPSFNRTTLENNVAFITIDGTFKGVPNVSPIGIWTGTTVNSANCFSIGWGVRIGLEGYTDFLRRVNYTLVTDQDCKVQLSAQPATIQCASSLKGQGAFETAANLFVCDNQLVGIQAAMYDFTDAKPIDLFTKLTAAGVQNFLFPPASTVSRKNYVSCN